MTIGNPTHEADDRNTKFCNMQLNDTDLFQLLLEIDTQLIEKDVSPHARPLQACIAIAEQLGMSFNLGDEFSRRVDAIYKNLYRPSDLELPPMHVGAFMFRDVFFPLRIPVIYGTPAINPVELLLDMTDFQKRWLFNDKVTGLTFFDQLIDLMDFAYGLDDFEKSSSSERTKELWLLAKRQLEAGAAAVLGSFDVYAVIQNSCIATELFLKGALSKETGMTDEQFRNEYGHGIKKLVPAISSILTKIDGERLLSVVEKLPSYTDSRYFDIQNPNSRRYDVRGFSRRKVGELLMNTQYVAGEVLRQFSKRNTRSMLIANTGGNPDWNFAHRVFPSKP